MKKLLLLFLGLFLSFQSFAQNGALFQTWYLTSYEMGAGSNYSISNISPHISPSLSIAVGLGYDGFGACNSYTGNFSYDATNDLLITEDFDSTLGLCDYQSHHDFESDYFSYFFNFIMDPVHYLIIYGDSGEEYLSLDFDNGYVLNYRNFPLAISDQNITQFKIYPNPLTNTLFINSENTQIEKIKVFSINGQQLIEVSRNANSIDVSNLSEGLYFLEIFSSEGKSVQKFIKQ